MLKSLHGSNMEQINNNITSVQEDKKVLMVSQDINQVHFLPYLEA